MKNNQKTQSVEIIRQKQTLAGKLATEADASLISRKIYILTVK